MYNYADSDGEDAVFMCNYADDDDEDWLYLICTPCLRDSLTFEGDRSVV